MTIIRQNGEKTLLPRLNGEDFWDLMHEQYAKERPDKWKGLAMLALRENAGWPLEKIGKVFGHHKGHVLRILKKTKKDLRNRFEQSPDWLRMDP